MSYNYSPLRYPGGKNCIFPFFSKLFYENNFIGYNYAEPYAGGAGLAIRLLVEGYVEHIYINDFDKSIFSFWHSIINHADEICEWIEKLDITIDNWNKYKNIQINKQNENIIDLAKSTFFLNRCNVSGIIKGGVIGGKEQRGKYKIDARFNKDDLIKKIELIHSLRNRINVSNLDAFNFINDLNIKQEYIFIYIDPPYLKKGADLYMNYYKKDDHQLLSSLIKKIKKEWLLTYDNNDYIHNLYNQFNILKHNISQSTSNRSGEELIIYPSDLIIENSIQQLKQVQILNQISTTNHLALPV